MENLVVIGVALLVAGFIAWRAWRIAAKKKNVSKSGGGSTGPGGSDHSEEN